MAENVGEMKEMIDLLVDVAERYGLAVNRGKCQVMVFNSGEVPGEIRGMKVVRETKYLGVVINDGKDCFRVHRERVLEKARRMGNVAFSDLCY